MMEMPPPALPLWIQGRAFLTVTEDFIDVCRQGEGEVLRRLPVCEASEIGSAVAAAVEALPGWAAREPHERLIFLQALSAEISRLEKHFVSLLREEMPSAEGDPEREVAQALQVLREWVEPPEAVADVFAVAAGGGSPLLAPVALIAAPLLAGSTVVLRTAPAAPSVLLALAELAARVGLPPGVLNVVHGDDRTTEAMLARPEFGAAAYAGGEAEGARIGRMAHDHDKLLFSCNGVLCTRCCNWLKALPAAPAEKPVRFAK